MQITVLGITGGVGRAVADAFLEAGFAVVALARRPERVPAAEGLTVVEGDALDPEALGGALQGSDLVLHGLNLPYPDWDPGMIELTDAVLAGALAAGATVLFPGNLYGLGPDFTEPLDEDAPRGGPARKGALRNQLEERIAAFTQRGGRAIVLRAGDFFGGIGESSWMHHLTHRARAGGALQYPGSRDTLHSWAFLPDVARTFVALARRRAELPALAVFHFEGHVVDGHAWIAAARRALGDERAVRSFPWLWLNLARPFVPMVRELFEMRYLWDEPVRMDGSRLRALLGEVPHTPLDQAVGLALGQASSGGAQVAGAQFAK